MSKLFYDHITLIDEIYVEVDQLPISNKDKLDIKQLLDELVHTEVLNCIFDHLPPEHHADFLERYYRAPHHVDHLKFVQEKVTVNIHAEIIAVVNRVKEGVLKDIRI